MGKQQEKGKDDKKKPNPKAKLMPKQTPKQTPRWTPKQKKTDEKLSLEELRDKRSHKGGELNNWDPAQLPIAHDLWQKQ